MARKKATSGKPAKKAGSANVLPEGYAALLTDLKDRIRAAQVKAAEAQANRAQSQSRIRERMGSGVPGVPGAGGGGRGGGGGGGGR